MTPTTIFRTGLTPGPPQRTLHSKCISTSDFPIYILGICCKTFLSIVLQVNVSATLGTLNVAAEVDGVKIKGDGEMHMTLSSSLLPNLNRQLQFVTYTNTLFHPSTADTGERGSSDLWIFEKKPQRIQLLKEMLVSF